MSLLLTLILFDLDVDEANSPTNLIGASDDEDDVVNID